MITNQDDTTYPNKQTQRAAVMRMVRPSIRQNGFTAVERDPHFIY
jgi:hypothetical protein